MHGGLRGKTRADQSGVWTIPLNTTGFRSGETLHLKVTSAGIPADLRQLSRGPGRSAPGRLPRAHEPAQRLDGFFLSGTATPNAIVRVSGTLRGDTQADDAGRWTLPLEAGGRPIGTPLRLALEAEDPAGNLSALIELRYELGTVSSDDCATI